jgi:hypothetical protein
MMLMMLMMLMMPMIMRGLIPSPMIFFMFDSSEKLLQKIKRSKI